jgi:hypothetical protein
MMYVYEFLWRGRPDGEVAYHVILADEVDTFGKKSHVESGVLTPEQAEEMGFPLAAIIDNINAAALKARDQAIAEKSVVEEDRDRLQAELDRVGRDEGMT